MSLKDAGKKDREIMELLRTSRPTIWSMHKKRLRETCLATFIRANCLVSAVAIIYSVRNI